MGSNRGLAPPKMPAVQTWLLQVNAASRCYSGENGSRDGHRSGGQQEMASKPKTRGPRWFETQNHTKNGLAFRCIYATSPDESYTEYYIQRGGSRGSLPADGRARYEGRDSTAPGPRSIVLSKSAHQARAAAPLFCAASPPGQLSAIVLRGAQHSNTQVSYVSLRQPRIALMESPSFLDAPQPAWAQLKVLLVEGEDDTAVRI